MLILETFERTAAARMLIRTSFAVTRHSLLNSRIAALLRSMLTLDPHPPERPGPARCGGDRAPRPGAERGIGHLRRRRKPPTSLPRLTGPARAIR
jgi:hypothetical protein